MFNNFLNTVKTAATNVAQSVEEQNRQGSAHNDSNQDVEETVGKIDSQGGKVQVTTVHVEAKKEEPKGADFLSGLVSVAQVVGKSLNEHNKQAEELKNTEETIGKVDSQGGKVQVTTVHEETKKKEEDKPDFFSGLVSAAQDIGKVVGKSFEEQKNQNQNRQQNDDVEETVGKVDSQGGKVQLTSVQDDAKKEEASGDKSSNFLSGLMNVAQDIGKAVEKSRNEQQPAQPASASEPQNTGENAPKFNDKDLKVLGENIGSIVGGLFKKEGEKKPENVEFKAEVVIDDVEGEIGKVTTSGYTATQKP